MQILIVEPDSFYQHQLHELFRDLGEVVITNHSKEAMVYLAENRPDFLVTELLLPEISGYEFLQELARLEPIPDYPIIIYSRVNTKEDIEQALGLGVTGFFVKGENSFQDVRNLILNLKTP